MLGDPSRVRARTSAIALYLDSQIHPSVNRSKIRHAAAARSNQRDRRSLRFSAPAPSFPGILSPEENPLLKGKTTLCVNSMGLRCGRQRKSVEDILHRNN